MNRGTSLQLSLAAVAGGLAWWTFTLALAPLVEREKKDRTASASLRTQIETARSTIQNVRMLETEASTVRRQIGQLDRDLPPGSATVWLPDAIKEHFPKFGMTVAIVRMNTIRDEPHLPGLKRGYWSVGVSLAEPNGSAPGALLAVAEFEQQHPFVKVLDFAIQPDPENPQGRVALFNVAALIRK